MTGKSEQIIELARKRVHPVEIALIVRTTTGYVHTAIRRARAAGESIPKPAKASDIPLRDAQAVPRQLIVTTQIFNLLRSHADHCGLTPAEAANRILENALLATERNPK